MNKTVRNFVERAIEAEFNEVQDLNFSDMTNEDKKEYDEVYDKVGELQEKLKNLLTDEQWKVFDEYIETDLQVLCLESRYMFNRGVKTGFNKLSYIKEELGNSVIML